MDGAFIINNLTQGAIWAVVLHIWILSPILDWRNHRRQRRKGGKS